MAGILRNILEAIGHTPLVELQRLTGPEDARVLVKVEGLNVGGSIKTRTALNMIEAAEAQGLIRPGSVIIDVSIDQGGNCAITEAGKVAYREGVCLCGVKNIPGQLPVDASWLYATNICNYVENLYKQGIGQPDFEDEIVRSSLVTREGGIHHAGTLKAMGLA